MSILKELRQFKSQNFFEIYSIERDPSGYSRALGGPAYILVLNPIALPYLLYSRHGMQKHLWIELLL